VNFPPKLVFNSSFETSEIWTFQTKEVHRECTLSVTTATTCLAILINLREYIATADLLSASNHENDNGLKKLR